MSKTKKKSGEDDSFEDGECFLVEAGHCFLGCCDCKLMHHYVFYIPILQKDGKFLLKPIDFPMVIRPFRDEEATKYHRSKKT